MLSEDKYSKHPGVKFATIICEQIILKEHKPLPLWVHKHVLTEIAQMATTIFQLITTATNVKKVEPRFTTLRIKKTFFPLPKLQPNSSTGAEGEAAGKWVCP